MTRLSQSEISQVESGAKRSPRIDTIQRIAYALEVSIDYLLGRYDYEGPLAKALAMESLALFLRKANLSEQQVRGLRQIAEGDAAPQSIREWGQFVANLLIYESSTNTLPQHFS